MPSIKELNQSFGPFGDWSPTADDARPHLPPFFGMGPYGMSGFPMTGEASGEDDLPPADESLETGPVHRQGYPTTDRFGMGNFHGYAGLGELPFRDGPGRRGGMSCGGRRGGFAGPFIRGGMGRGNNFGARGGLRHGCGRLGLRPYTDPRMSQFGFPFDWRKSDTQEFRLAVDVFDTDNSYIIHASVPGARKEDVAVSWDADRSELSIAGVVHRPCDEELSKTLALSEIQIGFFDRKIKLGTPTEPAAIEQDSISAKLEGGILRINVPKLEKEYIEVKKVDIE